MTPDPGRGTISIRQLSPAAGGTLAVKGGCPGGRADRVCSESWQATFDVSVDRDMTNAVLTARFYDGTTLCAYGANTLDLVPAGNNVSFSMNTVYLSDEFGTFKSACRLPVTTNRIEVELWSDHSAWTNTLIQNFDNAYTFR